MNINLHVRDRMGASGSRFSCDIYGILFKEPVLIRVGRKQGNVSFSICTKRVVMSFIMHTGKDLLRSTPYLALYSLN